MKCKNCNNLYNLTDIKGEIVGRCCPKINDSVDIEIDRACNKYQGISNGDKIRNMTDEDLAEFWEHGCDEVIDCKICKEPRNEYGSCTGQCRKEYLRWLRKEVE